MDHEIILCLRSNFCDAGFFGQLDSISSIRSTLALHLAFRFELLMNIDELAFEIAYLIHLLIY